MVAVIGASREFSLGGFDAPLLDASMSQMEPDSQLIRLAVTLFFAVLPEHVSAYLAPQYRFFFEFGALFRICRRRGQFQALFGFVLVPVYDRHRASLLRFS
jgi:hypothetical protein